jgi:hypothetical protein
MKRKRLQHVADNICQIFCGWQLTFDYEELARLGSGTVTIDLKNERCKFNGQPIHNLKIAGAIGAWLVRDLTDNGILADHIQAIVLEAKLQQKLIPDAECKSDVLWGGGTHEYYIACQIECESRVVTDERTYSCNYRDYEEWPEDLRLN